MRDDTLQIDHLVWATPDVDTDADRFASALGVRPGAGGRHAGLGTANHLLDLGAGATGAPWYLELIHPDPNADGAGRLGRTLGSLARSGLFHWAVRAPDLDAIHVRAEHAGLVSTGALPFERARPDGVVLRWRLLFLTGHPFGGLLPFFIDWMDAEHPTESLESGVTLEDFSIASPEATALSTALEALGIDVHLAASDVPKLEARISGPAGALDLGTAAPFGRGLAPA